MVPGVLQENQGVGECLLPDDVRRRAPGRALLSTKRMTGLARSVAAVFEPDENGTSHFAGHGQRPQVQLGAGLTGTMQKPQVRYRRARVAEPSRREALGLALAAAAAFATGSS